MRLAFDDDGPGPVLVLLHGFPLDRTMWKYQRAEVGAIYRIIAPDLRGQGETAVPDGTYTIDLMADDVIETLDGLGLDRPVVLGGLSMGGYVSLSLASRYPDRFRALILMNTRADADTVEQAQGRETLARQAEETGKVDEIVAAMVPRLFAASTLATHPQDVEAIKDRMLKASPRGLAGAIRGIATRPDRAGDLAAIRMPTLVIAGATDPIVPESVTRAMADGIAGARLEIVPDSAHLSPVENKAVVNRLILDFLKSVGD